MNDSSSNATRPDTGMSFVEIGVRDLDRATQFYGDLLGLPLLGDETDNNRRVRRFGAEHGHVRLVELGSLVHESAWQPDDLQCGIRHFGLKVADIDAWVERLQEAGVSLAAGPFDAFGGVRIAFFFDPDGAYLELVQGYVRHNRLFSEQLARQEVDADRDWDGRPRFDHVAVSVPDLTAALTDYRDELGFGAIGQLVRPEEERGFLITNLRAAPGTLEVFGFDAPMYERDRTGEENRLGLRAIGVRGLSEPRVGAGGVPLLPG